MTGKVFIVCEPTRLQNGERIATVNLTPAAAWGEIEILLQHNQSSMNPDATVELLKRKLNYFCDDDYLVPIGDPILMCICASIAADMNHGRVKLLKWDRIQEKYIPIKLDIRI